MSLNSKHLCQRLLLLFRLVFIFGIGTNSYASDSKVGHKFQTKCNLTVGWHHYPPFQSLNDKGLASGYQIDLIERIATLTGCTLNLKQQTFQQNQLALKEGKIDLTFDVTQTLERAQYGHFSIPYRKELLVLYVRPEHYQKCRSRSLKSLVDDGFRLGITEGIIYGDTIEEIKQAHEPEHQIYYIDEEEEELDLLTNGRIDGMLEDPLVMTYLKTIDPALKSIKSCRVAVYENLVSIMFSKKTTSSTLVEKFNAAIETIKQDENYRMLWGI